eukprot:CAMPEP_0172934064 /NCGR_PEP_ID=MMETSP1075-20121228/220822_1 /TAXON_ID=2916 /ORGANISM="Ceratium fusus, Strain PA161109" /LENGTH=76 /DNA_ID=CAMNT_0013795411 /DNA_START=435 /DNA_END=662 /DNA_ORIENTATION=-
MVLPVAALKAGESLAPVKKIASKVPSFPERLLSATKMSCGFSPLNDTETLPLPPAGIARALSDLRALQPSPDATGS